MSTASLEDSTRRLSVHESAYEDERNANNGYGQRQQQGYAQQQQQQQYQEPGYGYQGGHYEQRSYVSFENNLTDVECAVSL